MVEIIIIVFFIIALVFSVVIHEVAHGAVANSLGDPTAKFSGRLTLNPLKHLDPFGSFIIPFLMFLSTGIAFGYAKPVPINPLNLRDKRFGMVKVAVAGVAANFALALFFGLIIRFWPEIANPMATMFRSLLELVVKLNLWLMIFNLVPIPPLDGSHILFALLPASQAEFKLFLQRYGLIFFLVFVFYFSSIISPIVYFLGRLIVGAPLD